MKLNLKNLFVISFFLKLLLSWIVPVTLDEYYYFIWGQHLSLSYFDHPPMVGWIMALSQPLSIIGEGAIRWPFVFLSHCTLVIWLSLMKPYLKSEQCFWFLAVAILNPLWGLGAIIATPDIPLVFAWSLGIFFSIRVLSKGTLFDYLGLGVSLGLGFLSKYQIVLFIPCLVILVFQQKALRKVFTIKVLASILVASVLCIPVFIWNFHHDWSSFEFQWKHGMSSAYWKWHLPLEYLITQVMVIFPTFLLFIFNKNRGWLKDPLLPFVVFPFLFFLYSSFNGRVEANWVIMSFPALYALSFKYSDELHLKWHKRTAGLWLAVLLLALSTIPFKKQAPFNQLNLYEVQKFDPILEHIDNDVNYLTYSYQLSAFLSFKTGDLFCTLPKSGRLNHFHFVKKCQDLPKNFTFITEDWSNPDFGALFPGYEKTDERPISKKFKFIKVDHL